MFRMIWLVLSVLAPAILLAQPSERAEFDARVLSSAEKRLVQAGLALENHYTGLLDGAWGRGSQTALEAMSAARHNTRRSNWGHVMALVERLEEERRAQNWRSFSPQISDVSVLAPMGMLRVERARRGEALQSPDGGLQVRFIPQNIAEALTLATAVANRHAGSDRPYQSLNGDRLVVAAETEGGGGAYMRTAKSGNRLTTVLVEWARPEAPRARLVIASIRRGGQAGLEIPRGDTLAAMQRGAAPQTLGEQDADGFWPEPGSPPNADTAQGSGQPIGNAVYVNNTDLLTADHMVQTCGRPAFADGTLVKVVHRDEKRGLALITSGVRSPAWVDVPRVFPDGGQTMIVIGFRNTGASSEPMMVADQTEVLSRMRGQDQAGRVQLRHSLPVADHGSVVLDQQRKLTGLIVRHPQPSRANQNTNFIAAEYLRGFLRDNDVLFSRGGRNGARALTQESLGQVVRQIVCTDR